VKGKGARPEIYWIKVSRLRLLVPDLQNTKRSIARIRVLQAVAKVFN